MNLNPNIWAPIVIAFCTAVNIPGMLRGNWFSYTAFSFCVLIFIASVAMNMRSRR